jgi:hypothetical protein
MLNAYKVLVRRPEGKTLFERPRRIILKQWGALVGMLMNLRFP